MNRVVITGVGVNSPVACGFQECLEHIENGTKGLNSLQNFNAENLPTNFSGEVKHQGQVVKTHHTIDRKEVFINNAFEELLAGNTLTSRYAGNNININLGAGIDYFDLEGYISCGGYKDYSWQNYCNRAYDVSKKLAAKHGIKGTVSVNVSACVASSQAIGLSFRNIRQNGEKAVITGGYDSMLSYLHYMGFYKLGALSEYKGPASDACRPFDRDRCGLVIGEGGIALLLENDKNAIKENILGEIVGYCTTLDAFTITDPEPNGKALAQAALNAIKEAGITPNEIDCAHLHETGTIKNALAESKAMETIFGDRFREIPVYSMKGQIGHLIGACGAMEMMGVIYSLKYQKVPPTVNFHTPDPEVPVNVVRDKPLDLKIKYILKLNAAFGGQNSALVIKKYEA